MLVLAPQIRLKMAEVAKDELLRANAGNSKKSPVNVESWGSSDKVGFKICWRY